MKEVIIFASSLCGPCKASHQAVKDYRDEKNKDLVIEYYNVDLGEIEKAKADAIAGFDIKRVPVIVVDGVYIGGFADIKKLISQQG